MGKIQSAVECTKATFSYQEHMETHWQIQSSTGRIVHLLLSPTTPDAVIPFMLQKVVLSTNSPEFDLLRERMEIKPQNLHNFFTSNCQELIDGLTQNVALSSNKIVYDGETIALQWVICNEETNVSDKIMYSFSPGKEIVMDEFYELNKTELSKTLQLSKRDIRKLFVVTKKIIKLFPRISSKNTPVRGLYEPLAT